MYCSPSLMSFRGHWVPCVSSTCDSVSSLIACCTWRRSAVTVLHTPSRHHINIMTIQRWLYWGLCERLHACACVTLYTHPLAPPCQELWYSTILETGGGFRVEWASLCSTSTILETEWRANEHSHARTHTHIEYCVPRPMLNPTMLSLTHS